MRNMLFSVFSVDPLKQTWRGKEDPNKGVPVSARLLIQSSQVGCFMDKGGLLMSEMRNATGAGIRLFVGDQVPKCACETEEVVQINGDFANVQNALFNVTSRLREMFITPKPLDDDGGGFCTSALPEITNKTRKERMHYCIVQDPDNQTNLAFSMDCLQLSHIIDSSSSPVDSENPRSFANSGRGFSPMQETMEVKCDNKPAVQTNTTLEM